MESAVETETEKYSVSCLINKRIHEAVLELQDDENCKINLTVGKDTYSSEGEHFWGALIELRKKLEEHNIKLLCQGCCKNVYPSPMILDMGAAVKAYKMTLGKQAKSEDLVFIFDPCKPEEYASIEEQERFYHKWLNGPDAPEKDILPPIKAAVILCLVFYAIEIPMVLFNIFPNKTVLYTADFVIRCIMGTIALVLLNRFYKQSGDAEGFRNAFRGKISWKVCLLLCPLLIYILLPLLQISTGIFTTAALGLFCINALQQFATGYYEEALYRGLVMKGLLAHRTDTVKHRIITVLISGGIFGLSHLPNIVFGENPLLQVPTSMVIGISWAAIYMCTGNLTLSMCLHALTDLTPRIVGYLFRFESQPAISDFISGARDVIDYAVFPLMSILICVFYDKIKKTKNNGTVGMDRKARSV